MGPKHFFTLVVLSVTALSLMFVTYASQQKTNTQSDASDCKAKPIFKPDGSNSGDNYVTYKFTVKNPGCKPYSYGFYISKPGTNWYREYKINDGNWVSEYSAPFITGGLKLGETDTVRARIKPAPNAASKTYYLKATACQSGSTGDAPFLFENYCKTISDILYTKD